MPNRQTLFIGMPKPPRPTVQDEKVASRIAARIVEAVNLDEFYWTKEEVPDRIADVTQEIVLYGKPRGVFYRLWKKQPLADCSGRRGGHPYGWDGIDDHCRDIADEIAKEELERAVEEYRERYL